MDKRSTLKLAAALLIATGSGNVYSAEIQTGEWALNPSDAPGKVHLSLEISRDHENHFSENHDWNLSDLRGLDWTAAAKHDVRFTIARDAGSIECEGFVKNGHGAGLFTFTPNAQYSREMDALGFSGITAEKQIAFALHDVSIAFAREMKSLGLSGLTADKLLAFRIFGVDAKFIRDLRAAGLDVTDPDKLIAFRIHGVSPEFVRNLRAAGFDTTDPDKLIAFRIHGVSPDFIKALARLGYSHPDADQLIALRIHGVTPEYIERLRAHGLQNLSLDKLVSLRIQGID